MLLYNGCQIANSVHILAAGYEESLKAPMLVGVNSQPSISSGGLCDLDVWAGTTLGH